MSSNNTTKPTGGAHMRHVMESSDPNVNLLEQILSRDNVRQAWKRVKANKGAPGIDKMSIDDFPEFARTHWESIRDSLFSDRYQPLPVKRVEIPKSTGGTRPLGIPAVVDRVIQQAIYQVMMPVFDPEIDQWLRRRLRMCYWKRWRYTRTKVRNLRRLGTSLKIAIDVGLSRKGPWRLARTLATQTGMTNRWLKDQGLLSVKELWVNIHYPVTAR